MRAESVEWWTNISDMVAIAEVASTKKIAPFNDYWQSQKIRCTVTATLKGERLDLVTLRQGYREEEQGTATDDARLRSKTKVLLFCVFPDGNREIETIF
jgi:hypothetical protein